MKTIDKRVSHAFGKEVYLLGTNTENKCVWMEAAKWDCSWYWGFGHIEVYTNHANPDKACDITSHSHWSGLVGSQEYYDHKKGCFRLSSGYIYHINDSPAFTSTVLTDGESWQLADLMQTFYTLKSTTELYYSGNSCLTTVKQLSFKNKRMENHINQKLLPQVFQAVYDILTPKIITEV